MTRILIASVEDDLHALVVQDTLRKRGVGCQIVEVDRIACRETINVSIGQSPGVALLRVADDVCLDVESVDVVWWRRPKAKQLKAPSFANDDEETLVNNDCATAFIGLLLSRFQGAWISHPRATEGASNKLVQLQAAMEAGFSVPATLVSQVPNAVREFHQQHHGRVIVKPVAGVAGPMLFTQMVTSQHLTNGAAMAACPAIYQEFIPGDRHIRLNCFGDRSFAAVIQTRELDWRPNLRVPVSVWPVPDSVHRRVRSVLDRLGLEMGIIDIKETPEGELVWLEVNPQGQFLFLEGLCGLPLTELFCDYLQDGAATSSVRASVARSVVVAGKTARSVRPS